MVKPLNKEWELFGKKYRVPGAKGEKVDCNACHKQVSAAVNRLQSHLRVCPARPVLPLALAMQIHGPNAAAVAAATAGACVGSDLDDAGSNPAAAGLVDPTDGLGDAADLADSAAAGLEPASSALTAMSLPAAKRLKTSPVRSRWSGPMLDDYWLPSTTSSVATPSPSTVAYAKRRLEIDERRLQLELRQGRARRAPHGARDGDPRSQGAQGAPRRRERGVRGASGARARQEAAPGARDAEPEIDRLLPITPFASVASSSADTMTAVNATSTDDDSATAEATTDSSAVQVSVSAQPEAETGADADVAAAAQPASLVVASPIARETVL
ncbi:hypothetical protein PINS_up010896 [Pythium insidiosum]|nr:hypothetical protein PINS_up010896 [Pythium insidiosum]